MPSIKDYNRRLESLRSERSSFIDQWRELSDVHLANRGRFLTSDRNKGNKRNTKQINNTSHLAVRTIASGMMAGITSPARPWFRLTSPDPEINKLKSVMVWLNDVEIRMREVFARSNLYNSLHMLYEELATFGTGSMGVFSDIDKVLWCKPYTVGSYMFAMDGKNTVDTMYREYELTISQLVAEFGEDDVSSQVKTMFDEGNTEAWIKVVHVVEPNKNRKKDSPFANNKPYSSIYYEAGNSKGIDDKFLRISGFDTFPILAPRWKVTGEDVYGTMCPGMISVGDTKALYLLERRMFQAIDKVANPPVQAPSSLRNKLSGSGVVAGDIVFIDEIGAGVRSIYDYRPDLVALDRKINVIEDRISRSFYEDLFLMLANSDRKQITAREISERHEEKLLMLGPVLEQLHTELLDPLIDRTFDLMLQAGILPEPPLEIQGLNLKTEYISVLAQAQRLASIGSIDTLANFTGQLAGVWPEARHKFDALEAIDEYAGALGVSPRVVRGDDEIEQILATEREQQLAAAQQQQLESSLDQASKASNIDADNINDLMALTNQGTQPTGIV